MRRLTLLALLLCCACHPSRPRSPAGVRPPSSAALRDQLSLLATGETDDLRTAQEWTGRLHRGEARLEDYIDRLLQGRRFAYDVAPFLLLEQWSTFGIVGPTQFPEWILKTTKDASGVIIHHLGRPCAASDTEPVHPWWALESTIRICRDSHQPKKFSFTGAGGARVYCSGAMAAPEDDVLRCGCGPNLARCFRDRAQFDEIERSLSNEVSDTAGHLVASDLPLRTLFTSNETFRDWNTELVYRVRRMEGEQLDAVPLPDRGSWPAGGRWAARPELRPGQHAGVLTTPVVLGMNDAPRARMSALYEKLWCKEASSSRVSTEAILSLATADVRDGAGWRRLAAAPVCTDCHARLDYGMQFFAGYPNFYLASHFVPQVQGTGSGPLFGEHLRDRRGTAALAPRAFAELAVEQPEFTSCVTQKVAGHVFAHRASPEDRRAIHEAFSRTGTLRGAMRAALLRYAQGPRGFQQGPEPIPSRPAAAAGAGAALEVPAPVRALLDEHCLDCHSGGEHDLRAATLQRAEVSRMLTQVAFGRMPRGPGGMEPAARQEMVESLASLLFQDPAARGEALLYFRDWMRALPVHSIPATLGIVRKRAGAAAGQSVQLLEDVVSPGLRQASPGFAAVVALEALASCKAAGHRGPGLDRCLERAVSFDGLVYARRR